MEVLKGYDYDDVLLVPKIGTSRINSRKDVKLTSYLGDRYPIMSAPMEGISGVKLVKELSRLNCIGILHGRGSKEERKERIKALDGYYFGVAIGLKNFEEELEIAKYAVDCGADIICLDVANGYLESVQNTVRILRDTFSIPYIMAGNVVTLEGAFALSKAGANLIRVGIGGGNLCTTRTVTGVGCPQLTAIENCAKVDTFDDQGLVKIISDGGVGNSGNAVKSFVFGADFVMLGSLLANAQEAEHWGTKSEGMIHGEASLPSQLKRKFYEDIISVEGTTKEVTECRPLEEIINRFLGGIQSACTYLGVDDIRDLNGCCDIVTRR